jgi:hypothetical protein
MYALVMSGAKVVKNEKLKTKNDRWKIMLGTTTLIQPVCRPGNGYCFVMEY